ncbi:phenylacetate--CoA ligase [Solirubrobacter taibaiensis]|nr:phenylacetate--CoA ligase [Solirubrobacter taibaiensis]
MPTREAIERVVERVRRTPLGARIPADWERLEDLPFTAKEDLREHYPLGLITVPHDELRRVHASSGSRGKPTIVAYNQHDLNMWSEVMAYCMTMAGVKPGMVVHNAYGYGLFTGGLGFHQGAERIGALTVPAGGGVTARQALLLRDLQGQVLCSTPSYALHIAQSIREAGLGPDDLDLQIGLFGAEPWTDAMRTQLEAELGLTALNLYGLSEIVGPGVAAECPEARDGLHVMEDHFIVEVVDPKTSEPVPDGTDGELVFTTLTKEAMPLLRYRTGDIASLNREPCVCGRPFARMSPVRGRYDDMLIIRGVNLYPSQIEEALLHVNGVSPHYQLVVDRPGQLDELTLHCEGKGTNLAARVKHAIREQVGVTVRVQLRPMGEIPRSEGKAVRVIDRR